MVLEDFPFFTITVRLLPALLLLPPSHRPLTTVTGMVVGVPRFRDCDLTTIRGCGGCWPGRVAEGRIGNVPVLMVATCRFGGGRENPTIPGGRVAET